MLSWLPTLLSGVAVVAALFTLVRTMLVARHTATATHTAALAALEARCGLLEMKMALWWRLVEEHLSVMLQKPTHLEMDALLEKLRQATITLDECYRLRTLLADTYLTSADTPHRLIAVLVLGAVEARLSELERTS